MNLQSMKIQHYLLKTQTRKTPLHLWNREVSLEISMEQFMEQSPAVTTNQSFQTNFKKLHDTASMIPPTNTFSVTLIQKQYHSTKIAQKTEWM